MAIKGKTNEAEAIEKPKDVKDTSGARRAITLVAGDALVFLVFATIGRRSHGEAVGLSVLPQIAFIAAPFAIGWFIVSPFVGVFRRDVATRPGAMAKRTALAWVLAWPVGLFLRWLFSGFTDFPPLSFAVITLMFNLGVLLLWRWPFALVNSLKKG